MLTFSVARSPTPHPSPKIWSSVREKAFGNDVVGGSVNGVGDWGMASLKKIEF